MFPWKNGKPASRRSALPWVAALALGLTLSVPLMGVLAENGAWVARPFIGLWNDIPEPLRGFFAAWADWSLLLALLGAGGYLVWRIYLAKKWGGGTRVAIFTGGSFAIAMMRKMVPTWPHDLHHSVIIGAVIPDDAVRGQRAVPALFARFHPLRVVFRTQSGKDPFASYRHHKVASETYAPPFARLAAMADCIIRLVPLGGMTGTMTTGFTNVAGGDRPILAVVVGNVPAAILRSQEDPQAYARARAVLLHAKGNGAGLPWTHGKPEVVEVSQ